MYQSHQFHALSRSFIPVLFVGGLAVLLNGTLAWTFGQTSLTPAQTTAQRGQPDPLTHEAEQAELALQLPNRSAAAKRIAHERYAFMKWIKSHQSTFPGFYLLESDTHYGALLFPVGRSDRAYTEELPSVDERRGKYGRQYYRLSCYQRKEGRYQLVYRVNLEDPNRIVTRRQPAKKIARIETLLDDVSGYAVKGAISKFAKSDLSVKRDYVEYGVSLGEDGLYVTLFPANQGEIYSKGDWYCLFYDPYRKVNLEDDQFYQEYGLPMAKAELPLLK